MMGKSRALEFDQTGLELQMCDSGKQTFYVIFSICVIKGYNASTFLS